MLPRNSTIDIVLVQDVGLSGADDPAIWNGRRRSTGL
ncbi:MAG: hypothetical protein AB7N65_25265 [Vicinamibacterales bacterium]